MKQFAVHSVKRSENQSTRGGRDKPSARAGRPEKCQAIWRSVWRIGAVLFFLVGCTPGMGQENRTAQLPAGTVLFSDDFSTTSMGWGVGSHDDARVDYDAGGLRFVINRLQYDLWSVTGRLFEDVQIDADVAKSGGPDNNVFGLICRYQDQDNFYMLVASSDGYYGIAKVKAGRHSMIGSDQLQYSELILQGASTNHLRADCVGSTLSLSINGQTLMQAQDADFTDGDVGVLAGAYDSQGVDVTFHQFVVRKP